MVALRQRVSVVVSHVGRWAARVAGLSVLTAGVAAQTTATKSNKESPTPASDGYTCSSSQWQGRIGAGTDVIGDGYLQPMDAQAHLAAVFDFHQHYVYSREFMTIPTAGDASGTVSSAGFLVQTIDCLDAASINGYAFDLALEYRTNRQAAYTAAFGSGTATSACQDLDKDWNLSVLDRVEITGTIGTNSHIHYTSGSGSFDVGSETSNSGGETFWSLNDGFSILRRHSYGGAWVLDRHRPDGSVMRYQAVADSSTYLSTDDLLRSLRQRLHLQLR